MGRPGMTSVRALAGHPVAVESMGLGAYVLGRALEMNRLDASDIEIVHLEGDAHAPAFLKLEVDGAVTMEPTRSKLLEVGAEVLFDSTQIPGEIMDVLVMRTDYLRENAGKVQVLVSGWFRAVEYLRQNPRDAAERMAVREQLDAEQFLRSLSGLDIPSPRDNLEYLLGDPPGLVVSGRTLVRVMLKQGLLDRGVDVAALVDGNPVSKLVEPNP